MLFGFECDEDQTGWLAGLGMWSAGAAAGCLLAVATPGPAIAQWQVLALAVIVSLVSLGLRLPVMMAHCSSQAWLFHALWMLAFYAQVNWVGFLAACSPNAMIAAEATLICLGLEVWLLMLFVAQGKLPWLQQLFRGGSMASDAAGDELMTSREGEAPAEPTHSSARASRSQSYQRQLDEAEEVGDIRREFVDGIDENGQRYLSGSVRIQFDAQQRTEGFVLSFCPALDGLAKVELECDSENVTAKVEHATEIGARIMVRRLNIGEAVTVTVDWFATTSATAAAPHSMNLP